jgi:hypothetical protein
MRIYCIGLCAMLFLTGCGSRDSLQLAPVHGTVTYRGKPLDHGEVVFNPLQGTPGPQSVGRIDGGGAFETRMAQRKGAPVGKHVVTVHCRRTPTEQERRGLVVTPSIIPDRYGSDQQSPLRFEVKPGNNNCPIALE